MPWKTRKHNELRECKHFRERCAAPWVRWDRPSRIHSSSTLRSKSILEKSGCFFDWLGLRGRWRLPCTLLFGLHLGIDRREGHSAAPSRPCEDQRNQDCRRCSVSSNFPRKGSPDCFLKDRLPLLVAEKCVSLPANLRLYWILRFGQSPRCSRQLQKILPLEVCEGQREGLSGGERGIRTPGRAFDPTTV